MPVLIHGNQFISRVQITDSDLVQGCITKCLTPHNVHGQPIRPADVVLQHMAGLEQELSRLDEVAWNHTGMEREKIITNQMEPLEELLKGCKVYLQSIQNANRAGGQFFQDTYRLLLLCVTRQAVQTSGTTALCGSNSSKIASIRSINSAKKIPRSLLRGC